MTSDESVVAKLSALPLSSRDSGRSALELVRESGYFSAPEKLTVADVALYLTENSALVDHWLYWSEDKRASKGWYFRKTVEDFVVGYFPNGECQQFSDGIEACAEFVVREVAAIRETGR